MKRCWPRKEWTGGSPRKRRRRDSAFGYDVLRLLVRFLPYMTIMAMAGLEYLPAVEFRQFLQNTTIIAASQMCGNPFDLNHKYFVDGLSWSACLNDEFGSRKIPTTYVDGSGVSYLDWFVSMVGPVRGLYLFLRHSTAHSHDRILDMTLYDGINHLYKIEQTIHVFFLACACGLNNVACEMFLSWDKSKFLHSVVEFHQWEFKSIRLIDLHFGLIFYLLSATRFFPTKNGKPIHFDLVSIILSHGNLYLYELLFDMYISSSEENQLIFRRSIIFSMRSFKHLLVLHDWIPFRLIDKAHLDVHLLVSVCDCGIGSPHAYRVARERSRPGFMKKLVDFIARFVKDEQIAASFKGKDEIPASDAWKFYNFRNDSKEVMKKHREIYGLLVEMHNTAPER